MEACKQFEMTPLQYTLVSAIADQGSADQTTLAGIVSLDRTTTTDIIKRLHARGLVSRRRSDRDHRAQVCSLTPAGHTLLLDMEANVRRAHRDTIKTLSFDEQEMLLQLMSRIVGDHSGDVIGPEPRL